ncbi:uncharacterized protein LOC129984194 [Argiope bruennichi]|uniref:uncharacterized protein LOC129984194 n=1 Tax=Argiope bruennichi TaxID=94029 RepID=UPI00249505EF|nr:uncharacterized protein LOC129984194 [Argiope bruennichi]
MISKFILILLLTLLRSPMEAAEENGINSEDNNSQESSGKSLDPDVIQNVLENLKDVGDIKEEDEKKESSEKKLDPDVVQNVLDNLKDVGDITEKEEKKESSEKNLDPDVIKNVLENLKDVGDIIEGTEKSADNAPDEDTDKETEDTKGKIRKVRAAGTPYPANETTTATSFSFGIGKDGSGDSDEAHFNCECELGNYCKCCSHIKIMNFELDKKGCIQIEYISKELGLNLTFILDEIVVFTKSFTVLIAEPLCFDFPGLLQYFGDFCIHVKTDDDTLEDRLNVCMNLQARIFKNAINTFKVGCVDLPKKRK